MRNYLSFIKLIRRNEFKVLKGKFNSNIIFLLIFFYIAFLCFGFALCALNKQQTLSEDVISNWINLKCIDNDEESLKRLGEDLKSVKTKESFLIKNSYFYKKTAFIFLNSSGNLFPVNIDGRTIDPNSSVISGIIKNDTNIHKSSHDSLNSLLIKEPYGIIVTDTLLKQLGYNPDSVYYLSFLAVNNSDWVPVPVLDHISDLTDQVKVICSKQLYRRMSKSDFIEKDNYLRIFIENIDDSNVILIKREIAKFLKLESSLEIECRDLPNVRGTFPIKCLVIGMGNIPLSKHYDVYQQVLKGVPVLHKYRIGRFFQIRHDTLSNNANIAYDFLALEFQKLDKFGEFAKFIKDKYKINIPMETRVDKQNYLSTNQLAQVSISIILFLTISSIVIFISNVFKNYLERVRKNLGNFLAFGVKNIELLYIYACVALWILTIAIIIAYVLSYISGIFLEKFVLNHFFSIQSDNKYFMFVSLWFVLLIIVIIILSLSWTLYTIWNILKRTPGDLIYERENNDSNINNLFIKLMVNIFRILLNINLFSNKNVSSK